MNTLELFETFGKFFYDIASQEQVDELAAHITDIDYAVAEQREHEVRHDVMAHVYAYGKAAPTAAGSPSPAPLFTRAARSPRDAMKITGGVLSNSECSASTASMPAKGP